MPTPLPFACGSRSAWPRGHALPATLALTLAALVALATEATEASATNPEGHLVKEGEPRAVVVPQNDSEGVHRAVEELQTHLEQASGTRLPVMDPGEADDLDDRVRVIVGFGPTTEALGIEPDLNREEFRVHYEDGDLIFVGDDSAYEEDAPRADQRREWERAALREQGADGSWGTQWAVNHFLDHHMGVRWLWPGELGTHVPEQSTITVPNVETTERPSLERRTLRVNKGHHRRILDQSIGVAPLLTQTTHQQLRGEARTWLTRHRMGQRVDHAAPHPFRHWWDEYADDHPEVFATLPEGYEQPHPEPGQVKLCVANERVDELILEQWKEAGEPSYWPVSPNPGAGFCVCRDCRAMDEADRAAPQDVLHGRVNLSPRYVRFWNRVLTKLREHDPQVRLSASAYGAYREPPQQIEARDGIVVALVHTYDERGMEAWRGWVDAGVEPVLRPNWWHTAPIAPHLPLTQTTGFFEFAREHGMVGFDFDELVGTWSTQGPLYYAVARMAARPDLSPDEVLDEYAEAFGSAAPEIRRYLAYWEQVSEAAKFPVPIGNPPLKGDEGDYHRELERHGLPTHPLVGGWYALPFVYTPDVVGEAHEILDAAEAALSEREDRPRRRLAFLRAGLEHLESSAEVLADALMETSAADTPSRNLVDQVYELEGKRADWGKRHVLWLDNLRFFELTRHLPMHFQHIGLDIEPALAREKGFTEAQRGPDAPFPEGFDEDDMEQVDAFTLPEGGWRFRRDRMRIGHWKGYEQPDHDDAAWRAAAIDEFWHEFLDVRYIGAGWYRRTIEIPEMAEHDALGLYFGAIDESGWVWIDGQYVGQDDTGVWNRSFQLDVTDIVEPGEQHQVTIRVMNTASAGGIWRPVELRAFRARSSP